MGNESPIYKQCDQLHPEGEKEVWQVKQEPGPECLNHLHSVPCIGWGDVVTETSLNMLKAPEDGEAYTYS